MTFEEWLAYGVGKKWVSEGVCAMHDGLPMTEEETSYEEEGGDPCLPALRVWTENISD